ncbi:PREDICTED: eukaryotic translation initiation factor 4E transporter-like isoform X2 [Acropora digitifera]|uniref:eukaryotic translation initiation factor 4E transporter-like isoform X2 n=1 Tax=Acropora digitifera TaxID=70779 RepID=UPI00077A9DDE|nr:PREDICTED: eukaryotic translation initiation factor 4E transporter-like isoform X2 [Acropora digitifera]
MEVSELSEGCDVVTTTKEDSSSDGKAVKSDEVLAFPVDNDEETTRENQPRVTYTKEDLLNLRESPASKLWPSVFSDEYVRSGIWDPEPWHQSHSREKRCVSPGEELKKQLLLVEDGIVLSPQRQSFVQGCHIPQSVPERRLMQEKGKVGLIRTTDRDKDGRSRLTGRVGKGRASDYKELMPLQDSGTPSGKYTGTQERVERVDKGRGSGKDKEKGLKEKEWKRSKEDREQGLGRHLQ